MTRHAVGLQKLLERRLRHERVAREYRLIDIGDLAEADEGEISMTAGVAAGTPAAGVAAAGSATGSDGASIAGGADGAGTRKMLMLVRPRSSSPAR